MSEAVDTLDKKIRAVLEISSAKRGELDKTTFPSSNDVKNTTIIVIVNVIFFAIYLFLIDKGWTYVLEGLTWLVNKLVGL